MFTREELMSRIVSSFAQLESYLKLKSRQNLGDAAVLAEDFCKHLLNRVYGHKLTNRNKNIPNAPAIDLINHAPPIGFQITVDDTTEKIRDVHRKAIEHALADHVNHITILFLVSKAPKEPKPSGNFTRCETPTIISRDLTSLIADIREMDVKPMEELADFLEAEIRSITNDKLTRDCSLSVADLTWNHARVPRELSSEENSLTTRVTLFDRDERTIAMMEPSSTEGPNNAGKQVVSPECRLTYQYCRDQQCVVVRPAFPYLDRVRADEAEIEGVFFTTGAFEWEFPKLAIWCENRFKKPIRLVEAVLNVRKSQPILEAVPLIRDMAYQSLLILNEGWQPMANVEVSFQLLGMQDEPGFSLYVPEIIRCLAPKIESRWVFNLRDKIPQRFQRDPYVKAVGNIVFDTEGGRRTVRFSTRVQLNLYAGHGVEPSQVYDIFLKSGQTGSRTISLGQEIDPGGADCFLIRIGTNRSCIFECDLDLVTLNGAKVRTGDLQLELFVPRNYNKNE